MIKNHYLFILVGLLLLAVFAATILRKNLLSNVKPTGESEKLRVVTSFYPIYFFTSQIAGERAEVLNITPSGAEPHDFEPTTQDLVRINNSQLLILNGGGLEVWGERIKSQVPKTKIVIASEGLTVQIDEEGKNIVDPHVWLSPPLAKDEVDKITAGLVGVDGANAAMYQTNASNLKGKLDKLDEDFRTGLANCQQKDFITSHAAFYYLAREYGLSQIPIAGLSPDEEPPARQLAAAADFSRKNGVKYIFFERLVSPKLAETIASEVGAQTLVLDPIEGVGDPEIKQGKNYFTIMEENLKNLRLSLQCQ